MKNILLVLLTFVCLSSYAQDTLRYENTNELKINAPLVLAAFIDVAYEKVINDESAVGITLGVALEDKEYKFSSFPYYRRYFGKKTAAGFLIEGHGAFLSRRIDSNYELGLGMGFSIGYKFLSKSGWVAEVTIGVGRDFKHKDYYSTYTKAGIFVGKRF